MSNARVIDTDPVPVPCDKANSKLMHGDGCVSVVTDKKEPMSSILIMVLDSSGSMDSPADNKPKAESAVNFTRRDLVKHSVRTVAAMLYERHNTHLCLLHFSDTTRVLLPTMDIGKSLLGLQAANDAIDALPADGGTNLWDGLRCALKEANRCAELYPDANVQVMLLTDGEPSHDYNPPGGIARAFESKMKDMPKNVVVNCFGFGYRLDTDLLDSICTTGNGLYGYIPDSSMVGTVFINFCSHVLSLVTLNVESEGIHVPHLQAGFPFLVKSPTSTAPSGSQPEVVPTYDCLKAMEMVIHATLTSEKNFRYIHEWIQTVLAGMDGDAANFLKALQEDILHEDENKGQLMKAVSSVAWFNSWGKNHLLSYRRALILQTCVNFKDQALQLFRGPLFKEIQEMGTAKFIDLPAPTPTGYNAHGSSSNTNVNMANFVTSSGGCFSNSSIVHLLDGAIRRADECVKGDILSNGSVIKCVVRTVINKEVKMCQMGDTLCLTPWHPVVTPNEYNRDSWQFPCYIVGEPKEVFVEAFYDFVVEGEHQWALMDDYKVAMLGHGMTYNDVIRHPYYGTQEIIRVLQSKKGWETGLVDL
jgi:Mg-chelatase subunit ChlD